MEGDPIIPVLCVSLFTLGLFGLGYLTYQRACHRQLPPNLGDRQNPPPSRKPTENEGPLIMKLVIKDPYHTKPDQAMATTSGVEGKVRRE